MSLYVGFYFITTPSEVYFPILDTLIFNNVDWCITCLKNGCINLIDAETIYPFDKYEIKQWEIVEVTKAIFERTFEDLIIPNEPQKKRYFIYEVIIIDYDFIGDPFNRSAQIPAFIVQEMDLQKS